MKPNLKTMKAKLLRRAEIGDMLSRAYLQGSAMCADDDYAAQEHYVSKAKEYERVAKVCRGTTKLVLCRNQYQTGLTFTGSRTEATLV